MDKQILSLHAKRKEDELKSFLKSSGQQQVTECFVQYMEAGKASVVELLEAILAGYPPLTLYGSQGRQSLFKVCLQQLNSANITTKTSNEVVGLLLLHVDTLGEDAVVEIVDMLLDVIRSGDAGIGRCHPLLSKILSVVGKFSKVTVDGADLTGLSYRDQLINNICSVKWDPTVVLHLVSMFREVNLSDSELLFVLDKVLRSLVSLTEPHEIPPLISQVLLLSCKGHRRFVIEKVCSIFGSKDKELTAFEVADHDAISSMSDRVTQWRHAEGTTLLHFMYSIKQDPEMGKEFVKYLKAQFSARGAARTLHPFVIAVAMAMTSMNRFESQITDLLKAAILKHYRSRLVEDSSPWLRNALQSSKQMTEQKIKDQGAASDDVSDGFVRTVRYSALGGWDAVVPGFVHLGFTLMDSYGPKGMGSCSGQQQQHGGAAKTPACYSCKLGTTMLLATFEAHEMARQSILDHIIGRVVLQSTGPSTHFLDLLSEAVRAVPQAVLECLPRVREALEHLTLLPYPTAERLLLTVQPLLKISASLRDATLITLRKAIFGRSVEERKMAVTGFLMILKNFKILGGMASSQTQAYSIALSQVSVHSSGSSNEAARTKAFCLDVLGTLRRSLTLQADVRHCLYEGLYGALSSNTQLCAPVLDLLLDHVMPYLGLPRTVAASAGAGVSGSSAMTSNQAPLHLKACITHQADQVCISEPLSHLVSCVARCGLKAMDVLKAAGDEEEEGGDGVSEAVRRMQHVFTSLTNRLSACNPEDFELDQAAEFSPSSNVGLTNSLKALLALGVYEGVMEYEVCAGKCRRDACERALALFEKHQAISGLLLEKSVGPSASKNSSKAFKAPTTLFTLSFLSETVHSVLLLRDGITATTANLGQSGLAILRSNKAFVSFFVRALLARLQQVQDKGVCDGFDGKSRDKIFKAVCLTAEALLNYCCKACSTQGSATDNDSLTIPAFECLVAAYRVVGEWYSDRIADFLVAAGEDDTAPGGADVLEQLAGFHLRMLQKCLDSVLSYHSDTPSTMAVLSKLAVFLVELLKTLTGWLRNGSVTLKGTYDAIQSLCAKKTLEDSSVGTSLMALFLHLSKMQLSLPATIRSIAQDLHFILGDVEQDVAVESSHSHACLTEQNAAQVMQLVLTQFDADLDAVSWLLDQLHGLLPPSTNGSSTASAAASSSMPSPEDSGKVQQKHGQKAAVNRLGALALGLYDLIQTAVPFGPASEALVKSQIKLYDVHTSLMKYLLQLCSRGGDTDISRLKQLVELVGTRLTPYVYSFITYMQAMQNEHLKTVAEKKKGSGKARHEVVFNVGKAQVRKESKFIPNLIFAIEQYERFLVLLAKKLNVNFMEYVKLSTSRDFRINPASLQAALELQDETTESASHSQANESSSSVKAAAKENQAPPKKRTKKMDTSKASTSAGGKPSQPPAARKHKTCT